MTQFDGRHHDDGPHDDEAIELYRCDLEIARAVLTDARHLEHQAQIPSAARVWWRAETRLRAESARTAGRPIAVVQALAIACAVGLGASLAGVARAIWSSPWRDALTIVRPPLQAAGDASMVPVAVLAIALVWIVVAPIAVYLATADD